MERKRLALLFISLLVISTIINVVPVSAGTNSYVPDFIEDSELFKVFKGEGDISAQGESIKILALILIIVLVYSALAAAKFPDNAALRMILAIVVGLLATILITTEELVTTLQSYKALGIALTVFLPILILVFFSFIVASKGAPFGILAQKILWIIFSVYLFVTTATLLWLQYDNADGILTGAGAPAFFTAILGDNYFQIAENLSTPMLIVLAVVAVAVFFIFVLKNDAMTQWLAHQKRNADLEKQKDTLERSKKLREAEAKATRS